MHIDQSRTLDVMLFGLNVTKKCNRWAEFKVISNVITLKIVNVVMTLEAEVLHNRPIIGEMLM